MPAACKPMAGKIPIYIRSVAHCYAKTREIVGASDEDDDVRTQANRKRCLSTHQGHPAVTSVTPSRLRDLPARRRGAAANTVPWSQPAATSQSSPQLTHCPVCLMVICDIAIIPSMWTRCCNLIQNLIQKRIQLLRDVHVVLYAELTFQTPYRPTSSFSA